MTPPVGRCTGTAAAIYALISLKTPCTLCNLITLVYDFLISRLVHFSLLKFAIQPHKQPKKEKKNRNESTEGQSCEDGLLQKVSIPIILHRRNIMLQLGSVTETSLSRPVNLFLLQ